MIARVALVTEIIAPYRVAVFNRLSELLDGGLVVYFLAETEPRRDWAVPRDQLAFEHEVLGGARFTIPYRGDRQPVYVCPPLLPRLLRGRFDSVLVGGWNHLECYWSLAYTALRRKRFALWSETPLLGESLPHRPIRSSLKRAVVGRADAYAVPGPSAGRYLTALGADPAKVHIAPNAVDDAFWSDAPRRREHGALTLLYVGRLVRSKGLHVALAAYAASRLAGRARFIVAGDGPERSELERLAPPGVDFVGSRDAVQLRELYGQADMLVFPSLYDPWGLVVNEAACAGLPAIGSTGAGAAVDLIVDGENGLLVESANLDAWRAAFDAIADDPALPSRLAAGVASIAARSSPSACAAGLAETVT